MATITNVTELRVPKSDNNDKSAERKFNVFVSGTPAELMDYPTIEALVEVAVDPTTSLTIPVKGERWGTKDIFAEEPVIELHEEQNGWWRVTTSYSAIDDDLEDPSGGTRSDDPTNETIKYSWDSKIVKRKAWVDLAGIPMVMSSGEPPSDLPEIDVTVLTLQITRNTKTYDPLVARGVINYINDAPVTFNGKGPFEKGCVKCTRWAGTEEVAVVVDGTTSSEVIYDAEVLRFEILEPLKVDAAARVDLIPWVGRLADIGFYSFSDTAAGEVPVGYHPIIRNAQAVDRPQPLDGLGKPIYDSTGAETNAPVPRALDVVTPKAGLEVAKGAKDQKIAINIFKIHEEVDMTATGPLGAL